MNAFFEHHKHSVRLAYRCFDRILLNAVIRPFQQPERVIGFFWKYRHLYPVSRQVLHEIADQYHNWVLNRSRKWRVEIQPDPQQRRNDFLAPRFRRAGPDQLVAIIKAREPAAILTAIGKQQNWHLEMKRRWVDQYNFYVNDCHWGPMFVRVCPYFPFSARVCLNQHDGLAHRLRQRAIGFRQSSNAFRSCSDPQALQQLADSLTARDLSACAQKWLAHFTPFFTPEERQHAGVQHRLFFAQTEYCDNLIFRRRASLDRLEQRLLDANRGIGQPTKLTIIFGRRITRHHQGKLQTVIEDLNLPNPVIRSHYGHGFLKQYVRDVCNLRTEPATNNVTDYGVGKAVENLAPLRQKLNSLIDRYHDVQQDILQTFVDRGQLRHLTQPTVLPNGKRIPGLKLDHPRQLALMQALVRFCYLAAGSTFTTPELYPQVLQALRLSATEYKLSSLRYDLWKLRAKGLIEKLPHSRRYQLLPSGYQICLLFLKLFEKIYAPLTAAILQPFAPDKTLPLDAISPLDRRYHAVLQALDNLTEAVGLNVA